MASKRWTANPARPKRYRPGKGEDIASDSDDFSEEDAQPVAPAPAAVIRSRPTAKPAVTAKQIASVSLNEKDKPVIDEDEFETESEDEEDSKVKSKGKDEDGADESTEEEESDSDEDSESEEEESSEDEAPRKLLRPTFIRKDQRQAQASSTTAAPSSTILSAQSRSDDPDEIARKKAAADALVQEQLDKQAAARAAGRKFWDDDEDNLAASDEVDDTDGLDPAAELAAWKLRELKRVKRARDAIEAAEAEHEEIERRRNLTAEERDAEDRVHVEGQKAEREGRGEAGFMKKYYHKGAFFQGDDDETKELRERDLMGARFADETNRELLPEYMQIRDMTKLGRKGRTKYRDLRSEDTGRWGMDLGAKGRERFRGDERFAPDISGGSGPERSGANAAPVAMRRPRERSPDKSRERRDDDDFEYTRRRARSRSKSRSRSLDRNNRRRDSRSRSDTRRRPRRRSRSRRRSYSQSRSRSRGAQRLSTERDDGYRKRSRSPYSRERLNRDKRRRVEAS